jgi:hypothetical protein
VSVFFEPFIELIYDTLISVMTEVDPRNLMYQKATPTSLSPKVLYHVIEILRDFFK